jgi:TniQ
MRIQRLPVAPRPYRDELSTSWLSRVACRYGLDANELASHIVNDAKSAPPCPICATAWTPDQTRLWAQTCGLDPARVQRLSLAQRYPLSPTPDGYGIHAF